MNAQVWSILLSMIIAFIIAFTIENVIISGYVFQEFGFFGTKFIKEETREVVIEQHDSLINLNKNHEALYTTQGMIYSLFHSTGSNKDILINDKVKSIANESFDYLLELGSIIKSYYRIKQVSATVFSKTYDMKNIKELANERKKVYNLNSKNDRILINCMKNKEAKLFKSDDFYYFVISTDLRYSVNGKYTLLMIVESGEEFNPVDCFIILALINCFELEVQNVKMQVRLNDLVKGTE